MTTYEFYSISLRVAILLIVSACIAIVGLLLFVQGAVSGIALKCLIAFWALVGGAGIDIVRNHYKEKKRLEERMAYEGFKLRQAKRFGIEA